MANRLADKIVFITGAAGTIGKTVAQAIAREGGVALGSDLKGRGADFDLDVTQEAEWQRVMNEVERRHGRLDGLVNSAGIGTLGTVEDTDFADYRRVMAVNVDGTFLGCNASKGAVRLLSKSVALYGARLKPQVRSNSVHPSFVESDMVDTMLRSVPDAGKAREKMTRDIPLGRFADPKEIAALAVYLLSDESGFTTGAEFPVDGGLSAR